MFNQSKVFPSVFSTPRNNWSRFPSIVSKTGELTPEVTADLLASLADYGASLTAYIKENPSEETASMREVARLFSRIGQDDDDEDEEEEDEEQKKAFTDFIRCDYYHEAMIAKQRSMIDRDAEEAEEVYHDAVSGWSHELDFTNVRSVADPDDEDEDDDYYPDYYEYDNDDDYGYGELIDSRETESVVERTEEIVVVERAVATEQISSVDETLETVTVDHDTHDGAIVDEPIDDGEKPIAIVVPAITEVGAAKKAMVDFGLRDLGPLGDDVQQTAYRKKFDDLQRLILTLCDHLPMDTDARFTSCECGKATFQAHYKGGPVFERHAMKWVPFYKPGSGALSLTVGVLADRLPLTLFSSAETGRKYAQVELDEAARMSTRRGPSRYEADATVVMEALRCRNEKMIGTVVRNLDRQDTNGRFAYPAAKFFPRQLDYLDNLGDGLPIDHRVRLLTTLFPSDDEELRVSVTGLDPGDSEWKAAGMMDVECVEHMMYRIQNLPSVFQDRGFGRYYVPNLVATPPVRLFKCVNRRGDEVFFLPTAGKGTDSGGFWVYAPVLCIEEKPSLIEITVRTNTNMKVEGSAGAYWSVTGVDHVCVFGVDAWMRRGRERMSKLGVSFTDNKEWYGPLVRVWATLLWLDGVSQKGEEIDYSHYDDRMRTRDKRAMANLKMLEERIRNRRMLFHANEDDLLK